jgi:hypothetical protein
MENIEVTTPAQGKLPSGNKFNINKKRQTDGSFTYHVKIDLKSWDRKIKIKNIIK